MPNSVHQLPVSHFHSEQPIPPSHLPPPRSSSVPRGGVPNTAVVTIDTGDMDDDDDDLPAPAPKRLRINPASVTQPKPFVPGIPLSNSQALSISEMSAVKQLITGVCVCTVGMVNMYGRNIQGLIKLGLIKLW